MKKHIPNAITSLNVFSGCIATVMAFHGEYFWVLVWVIMAAIFDFFDGLAARLLKVHSPMGKELDSLADVISFGLAPSMAVFSFLGANVGLISTSPVVVAYLPYFAFLLAIFSALRLAKFNVDERQTESFIGLATPANGLFWTSLLSGLAVSSFISISPWGIYLLLAGILIFSLLMISEVAMFSLKVKNLKLRGNELRYCLILFILVMLVLFRELGIAAGILVYIALSVLDNRNKAVKAS